MAAAFITFISPLKPNPSSAPHREANPRWLSRSLLSPLPRSEPVGVGRSDLRRSSLSKRNFENRLILFYRRLPRLVPFTAHEESIQHVLEINGWDFEDIEVEKERELKFKEEESQEAWKLALKSFKEEAKKMKELSQDAYELYSKRAIEILKETSEALKIQADNANHDFGIIAKEISQESQVYLSIAAENSPESIKDIVETFASSSSEIKEGSAVRDFYFGIPYGAFLAAGGFLNFMLTGSIPAIRFGVILGSSLLALSISSLRSWKRGQSSELFLKGQTAIATVIFIREWRLFFKIRSFPTLLMTLLSGAMVAFYLYQIMIDDSSEVPPSSQHSEK
ncbi:hypothetical protein KSP40_PGU007468 [Platanthera guangdongensis]|uniref:Protein FATTY ACID EXPORT 3, chloroplastic n=1 Tax=Platanthera guangdongensis TaxID=2320717 RepID=A0ABR2M033_9ASPA